MTENPTQKTIILGVTGSIAAYKAVSIASELTKAGFRVPVIMTDAAQRFVQPLSFEAITHQPVYTGLWQEHMVEPRHIGLAEQADLLLIAPCTANMLAKLAHGFADDLLSCTALATRAPIMLAPAMNDHMYAHEATQQNRATLHNRGVLFVGPDGGRLASGKMGTGRMSQPESICTAATHLLEEGHTS